uniref:Large ribosomal subunit protein uL30m n=1 Tax=Araucaria cunninghamii TaxID=56994 RepID=A0A0D6QXP1_ARACU
MGVYNGSKAAAPIAWSARLYITLVRGLPGTRKLHRRTLQALGLQKCQRTVVKDNTSSIRGMINQVKRLVAVETEEMYKARMHREAEIRALRPPIVVQHLQTVDPSPQQS